MARGRATSPVDTGTLEGRLRAARLASPYSAQDLAEACGLASEVSIYEFENPNKRKLPSIAQLAVIARKTGKQLDWLVYGEGVEDAPFISRMRELQDELDYRAQQNIVRLAESEAEQYRARQAREDSFNAHVERLVAAGFDREAAIRAARVMLGTEESSEEAPEDEKEAEERRSGFGN